MQNRNSVAARREALHAQGWRPQAGVPEIYGRFVDHEPGDGPSGVFLEQQATHIDAVRMHDPEISSTRLKANNASDLCGRFAEAWDLYQHGKGKRVQAPTSCPLAAAGFSPAQVERWKSQGIHSLQALLAVPDSRAVVVLGQNAYLIRQQATEALKAQESK